MSEASLPRMRIRKGRVMHRVHLHGNWYESLCRRGSGVKGVSTTHPRAQGYAEDWSTDRFWYPDCQHCPDEPDLRPGAYLIWSNHHKCWWGPNGSGYRSHIADAGRYDYAEAAHWLGRGCGCCKAPEVLVPAPSAEMLTSPEALAEYAREAPKAASRKQGRINRYYDGSRR